MGKLDCCDFAIQIRASCVRWKQRVACSRRSEGFYRKLWHSRPKDGFTMGAATHRLVWRRSEARVVVRPEFRGLLRCTAPCHASFEGAFLFSGNGEWSWCGLVSQDNVNRRMGVLADQ